MRTLPENECLAVSAGAPGINVISATKTGAQIGAPLGAIAGCGFGFLYGAAKNNIFVMGGAMIAGTFAGFYAGAAAVGAVFGGVASILNITGFAAWLIYS